MAIAAYDRYGMLAAQGRNPAIIRRNWRSGRFQFGANSAVGKRRLFVHIQNLKFRQIFGQPLFILSSVTRNRNAITIFAENDHRNRELVCLPKQRLDTLFAFSQSRKGVRVENQRLSSGSICSNSSSMRLLTRLLSLRKCLNLPKASIQGASIGVDRAASFSLTASVTNSRKGIPRSAATDFARRKMASGISSVVFMNAIVPYLWERSKSLGLPGFAYDMLPRRGQGTERHAWVPKDIASCGRALDGARHAPSRK